MSPGFLSVDLILINVRVRACKNKNMLAQLSCAALVKRKPFGRSVEAHLKISCRGLLGNAAGQRECWDTKKVSASDPVDSLGNNYHETICDT